MGISEELSKTPRYLLEDVVTFVDGSNEHDK